MAHVGIAMLPEPGHYLPTLSLAHSLRELGHIVSYVTLPQFEGFFHEQGFATRTVQIPGLNAFPGGDIFGSEVINRVVSEHLNLHLARTNLHLSEFIGTELRSLKANLLICDSYFRTALAPIISDLNVELVFLNVTLPNPEVPTTCLDHRELILCPYEFEIPETIPLAPERMYGEPSIYRQRKSRQFTWSALRSDRPMVYCSFGSQAAGYPLASNVFRCLLDTFARLSGLEFVLVVDSAHQSRLGRVSENVVIAESAPQLELLDRAAAFVTHGGLGSVKEAILACVPMVVIPFSVDQPANATRIEYHKLGHICRPSDCSSQRLAELLVDVASDRDIKERLKVMCELFKEIEEKAPISKYLERLLLV